MVNLVRRIVVLFVIGFLLGGCTKGLPDYNKGVDLYKSKQIDLAEQCFKTAIQKNPKLSEAYLNLGRIYIDRGLLDGAETNTQKAIDLLEETHTTCVKNNNWKQTASVAYCNIAVIELSKSDEEAEKDNDKIADEHFTKAKKYIDTATKLDANNSGARELLDKINQISQILADS